MRFFPLILGCAALPAAALAQGAAPHTVTVQLSSFSFTPETLRLRAGEAIDLRLVNTASGGHNFAAPAFFAAARIDPADAAKVRGGKIEIGGRETVDVHLTVPAPGRYELHCSHPFHTAFGMRGSIEVQ